MSRVGAISNIDWYRGVPWLVLVLALINIGWALRAVATAPVVLRPPEVGALRQLHQLSPVEFVQLQRRAGAPPGSEIVPDCALFGPLPDVGSALEIQRRVSARGAGVSLVRDWQFTPRGHWVAVGPFGDPGARHGAARRLAQRGWVGFVPEQDYWRDWLVIGSATEAADAAAMQAALLAEGVVAELLPTGDMDPIWWLRILRWDGSDSGRDMSLSVVFSDGSGLVKKSCKSIAKPNGFD